MFSACSTDWLTRYFLSVLVWIPSFPILSSSLESRKVITILALVTLYYSTEDDNGSWSCDVRLYSSTLEKDCGKSAQVVVDGFLSSTVVRETSYNTKGHLGLGNIPCWKPMPWISC